MGARVYRVVDEHDVDCFCLSGDYETALGAAREAAQERPTTTILLTYKGFVIRELSLTTDGRVAEEEITSLEAVDRTLLALAPQPPGSRHD
jgi:hypothetical protein